MTEENKLEAQAANSNSIIGLSKVVVEYMEDGVDVIVTPDTPLPVTGSFSGGTVTVSEPISISYTDGETEVPVTPTEPLPVTLASNYPTQPDFDPWPVYQPLSQDAFGGQIVSPLSQEVALTFNYFIDTDELRTYLVNSGTVTASNSRMLVSTGTTTGSIARVKSNTCLRYRPGMGAMVRFTLGVTTGITGTEQTAGIGDEEDGYFFSYREHLGVLGMNIVRRSFGKRENRTLTITAGSTSAGNITIVLNGTTYTIAMSNNAGDANETATEIANEISTTDWIITAKGNEVVFIAAAAGVRGGSYSFSAGTTGMTATLTQQVVGVAYSEEVIPQTSWNCDPANGSKGLPNMDWSKGNVFQIKYQWLGFGMIQFYIEDPNLGRLIKVHAIKFANTSTIPSLANPTMPFYFYANNGSTSSNVEMFTGNCAGFVEGNSNVITGGNQKVFSHNKSVGSSETYIASLYNKSSFKNKNSRIQCAVLLISVSAADAVTFKFYRNSTLTGTANWTTIGANSSVYYDTASDGFSGGSLSNAMRAEQQTVTIYQTADVQAGIITLHTDDILTITGTTDAGTVKVGIAINWIEYM